MNVAVFCRRAFKVHEEVPQMMYSGSCDGQYWQMLVGGNEKEKESYIFTFWVLEMRLFSRYFPETLVCGLRFGSEEELLELETTMQKLVLAVGVERFVSEIWVLCTLRLK